MRVDEGNKRCDMCKTKEKRKKWWENENKRRLKERKRKRMGEVDGGGGGKRERFTKISLYFPISACHVSYLFSGL